MHDVRLLHNPHPNVFIENKQIKQVYECKTLGVKIDQHLSWKGNTDEIRKKVSAGISAIRRIKPFVDQETLILIYNAIVRPYFDYCCEVWDVFSEGQSKRLQKLQNRAARIILNVSNDVEHTIALRTLGWEPLQTERKIHPISPNVKIADSALTLSIRLCRLDSLTFYAFSSYTDVRVRGCFPAQFDNLGCSDQAARSFSIYFLFQVIGSIFMSCMRYLLSLREVFALTA